MRTNVLPQQVTTSLNCSKQKGKIWSVAKRLTPSRIIQHSIPQLLIIGFIWMFILWLCVCFCLSDWLNKAFFEVWYPSVLQQGIVWVVSFFHSLSYSSLFCQLTHPFQESLVGLMTVPCNCLPSEQPNVGSSYYRLIQDIGARTLWGCSAVRHFSDIVQWSRSHMSAFVDERPVFVC